MKYLKSIFFIFAVTLAISSASCRRYEKIMSNTEIFNNEIAVITQQQGAMRKARELQSLQEEYRKALTLSNIGNLELLLENYELSDTEKQNAILNYFGRALLYMQISLLPENRDLFLSQYVNNALLYETGAIFIQLKVVENFLQKSVQMPSSDANRQFQSRLISYADDRKIEYNTLHINKLDAAKNMPEINCPVNDIPAFKNANEYHFIQNYESNVFDAAKNIYAELHKQYDANLPLLLIKMLYKSPAALAQLYYTDNTLKKDFCMLMTELVRIYQNEQLFNTMQNTFSLRSDMQQVISDNNTSVEMLDAAFKSEITYQLAYLKMLANIGKTPFSPIYNNDEKAEQISESRTKTLRLLFNDVLKSIL